MALITGPAGIALIGQFSNFFAAVGAFSNGAINNGVVKYTAEYNDDESKRSSLFSTSLKLSFYLSILVSILIWLFARPISVLLFNSAIYATPVKVLAFSIVFYSVNSVLIAIINGQKNIRLYTAINTVGSIISLVTTVLLVKLYKVDGALYAIILSQSLSIFTTLALLRKTHWLSPSLIRIPLNKQHIKKLSHFSLMTIVSTACVPITQIALRKIAMISYGENAAGYWQGMMRISDGYLLIATTALSTYYLPQLSSITKRSVLNKEMKDGYIKLLPIVVISAVIIYLSRYAIINVLYSANFILMEKLFFFQLLGDVLKISSWFMAFVMLAKAMTKMYIITEILASLSYIALCIVFSKHFGIVGFTIAFAVNYLLYNILIVFLYFKYMIKEYRD